jgi:hypothetical protein
LAIKLFSITPHSASCERIFSSLGWFFGKRQQRLNIKTLQSMAKIHRYSLSNMKTSVGHLNEIYKEEELHNLLFEVNNNLEEDIENEDTDNNFNQVNELEYVNNNESEENLNIEESVNLGPWIVIEVGQIPEITNEINSSDEEEEDFDPKVLAKEIRTDIENNEYNINE